MPCLFDTFNIIISHIFSESFIGIPQVVQKICRFSPSILSSFINFSDFLTLSCYKETYDVGLQQMMSACFYFQTSLNMLFNSCIDFRLVLLDI